MKYTRAYIPLSKKTQDKEETPGHCRSSVTRFLAHVYPIEMKPRRLASSFTAIRLNVQHERNKKVRGRDN